MGGEFVVYSDHEALKSIQRQHKLNPGHLTCVEYLQALHFVFHHKSGNLNNSVDAFFRRYLLLFSLYSREFAFEFIKELHPKGGYFKKICENYVRSMYYIILYPYLLSFWLI